MVGLLNALLICSAALAIGYVAVGSALRQPVAECALTESSLVALDKSYYSGAVGESAPALQAAFVGVERARAEALAQAERLGAFIDTVDRINALEGSVEESVAFLTKTPVEEWTALGRRMAAAMKAMRDVLGTRFTDEARLESWKNSGDYAKVVRAQTFLAMLRSHTTAEFERVLRRSIIAFENVQRALDLAEPQVKEIHKRAPGSITACAVARIQALRNDAATGLQTVQSAADDVVRSRLRAVDAVLGLFGSRDPDGVFSALEARAKEYDQLVQEVTRLYNDNVSLYGKARAYHTLLGYALAAVVAHFVAYYVAHIYYAYRENKIDAYFGADPDYEELPLHNWDIVACKSSSNAWQRRVPAAPEAAAAADAAAAPAPAAQLHHYIYNPAASEQDRRQFNSCIRRKYLHGVFWIAYFSSFALGMTAYHFALPVLDAYMYQRA